jgi:3-dehydrosphinganine reductase
MNFVGASEFYGEFFILVVVLSIALPIIGVIGVLINWKFSMTYTARSLEKEVYGKHCLVTGGSQGLGKAICVELLKAGAHVTLVARNQQKLDAAVKELEQYKTTADQIIQAFSVDLTSYEKVLDFTNSLVKQKQQPKMLFANAGSSVSGFLADQLPVKNQKGPHEYMIEQNYYSAVNIVRALIQSTIKNDTTSIASITPEQAKKLPKRIVLVGSVLSVLSMVGYSAYSGSKYAIRGFAEALRSELTPLGIMVSLYLPGNMDTPGFEQESIGKPEITMEIEGASTPVTAKSAAESLLGGVLHDRFFISNDLLGELARVSVNGGNPRANLMIEVLATPLLAIVFSVWAMTTDIDIKTYFKKKNVSKVQ